MMDYTLPIAKRTRLREAEMYRKLHDEIRNNRKNIDKDLLEGGPVGVQDEKGKNCKENCGVNPVILDDSEDDVVFLDESDEGYFKEGKEFVNLDDSDNDDYRVGFDGDSKLGMIKGVDFVRVKTEGGTENESFRDFNRDINVGKISRDLKSDRKREGRTRLLQPRRKVSLSSNGVVFDGERNWNVEMMSSGIDHEDDGVDLTGRKSNEVAWWTELPSKSHGKNKGGCGGDDDICYVSEDIEESESSSSGGEEEEQCEEDSDEEIEVVKEEPGDGDYEVELSESSGVKALSDGEEEKGDKEKEDTNDDDREQSEVGLPRKKVCGIEILRNSNNGKIDNEDIDKNYSTYKATHTRSHNDSESVKKRMKLGTAGFPLCVDKKKLNGNSDVKNDSGTYEAGDVVRKARPQKGGSRGVNGGDGDDNDEKTCKSGQTTRSQKRINEPRKGSREENVLDLCRGKPNKRKWTEEEEDADDDNREQGEVGLKRKKVYGIEILCNSNNGKIDYEDIHKDYSVCLAKLARSHYDSDSVKKRMKLGIVSRPPCVDEEKVDDNSDDENNSGTCEAGDMARKVRLTKRKGSRGVNGGNVDDDEKTCKVGQTPRSQKRINGVRKGSRKQNVQRHICGGKPRKRKRIPALKEHEVIKILADSVLDQEEVPVEEQHEPPQDPALPLKFTFGIGESTSPEKSEDERELEGLWADVSSALC